MVVVVVYVVTEERRTEMAMLKTPSHQCQQVIGIHNGSVGSVRCPYPAYRRVNGLFYCRTHGRIHKTHTHCVSCK